MNSKYIDLEKVRELIYKDSGGLIADVKDLKRETSFIISENINFLNDKWDFSKYKLPNHPTNSYIFRFDEIKTTKYKILLKRMILRQISSETSFNTITVSCGTVKSFIRYLENEKFINNPELINKRILENFVGKLKLSEKIKRRTLGDLKKFLIEIEVDIPSFTLKEFNKVLKSYDLRRIKIQNEIGKTPNIPNLILDCIIKLALDDIDNENLRLVDRMTSCLILIVSQIGIRRTELLVLERNRLKEIEIFNGEKSVYYLEFFTSKTTRSPRGNWTESYMNDIAVMAYRKLEFLSEDRINEGGVALYPNPKGDFYSVSNLDKSWTYFFIRHQNKLGFELLNGTEIEWVQEFFIKKSQRIHGISQDDIGKRVYKINPHQFRVAVANQLKNQGVSLQWIKEHMNHLEEDMTKHYFRNDKVMESTLIKRASKDGTMLETNPNLVSDEKIRFELSDPYFKEAYEAINKYLKKNKVNVYRDFKDIIKVFKETPISGSEIGFCTKAFGKLCERQERLAAMERWYYARPQIIDITLIGSTVKRLEEKLQIVNHNYKVLENNNKYQNDYQRELMALKKFYLNKFEPEFEFLKKSLENDYDSVIALDSELEDVALNISRIEKLAEEAREWIQMQN